MEMSETLGVTVILVLMCTSVYGLFLLLFRSGRRKRGAKIIGASIGGGVVTLVAMAFYQISLLSGTGFESVAEYREAERFGITDAHTWAIHGPSLVAEVEAAAERALAARRAQAEAADRERQAREAEEAAAREREQSERRTAGFHCLSSWDGSHSDFLDAVRDQMREPDSFEHIETRITPVNEAGTHTVFMQYRARNGFGGMNVGTAIARVRNSDCGFTIISLE